MMVYQLFYVSNNISAAAQIEDILMKSREYNSKQKVSGVLLYRGGLFLQLLEGSQEAVETLYRKIEKDPRHGNVIQLFSVVNNERLFEDWSMAFNEISDIDLKMINEVLSWNKLLKAEKDIDNKLILQMLDRFKHKLLIQKSKL